MIEQLTATLEIIRCDRCHVPGGGGTREHDERAYALNISRAQLLYKLVNEHGWTWDTKSFVTLCERCSHV